MGWDYQLIVIDSNDHALVVFELDRVGPPRPSTSLKPALGSMKPVRTGVIPQGVDLDWWHDQPGDAVLGKDLESIRHLAAENNLRMIEKIIQDYPNNEVVIWTL